MFILIVYSWPLTKEVTWTNICEGVQYSQNTKSTQNNSRESETNTELSKSRWEINAYLNIKVRLCTYLYLHYIKNSCKEKGKGTDYTGIKSIVFITPWDLKGADRQKIIWVNFFQKTWISDRKNLKMTLKYADSTIEKFFCYNIFLRRAKWFFILHWQPFERTICFIHIGAFNHLLIVKFL